MNVWATIMTKASFKHLKTKSQETFEELRRKTSYNAPVKKGSMYKNRIKNALDGYSYFDDMRICDDGRGPSCHSVFCGHCRKVKQSTMYENYTNHFGPKYNHIETEIRDNARFGTVLHSLVPVNVDTGALEIQTINSVVQATTEIKSLLTKIRRRANNSYDARIWLAGGIHIELVDYDRWMFAALSGRRTSKQKTYNEFIERSSNNPGGHYFLIHTHFLCDKDGIDDDEFKSLFHQHWNQTSRQVLIQRLTDVYETEMGDVRHELDTAYRNIANYCYTGSNHGLAYAKNWGNSGKVVKTKVDAKGQIKAFAEEVFDTTIDDELTLGDLRLLVQVHNELTKGNNQGLRVQVR